MLKLVLTLTAYGYHPHSTLFFHHIKLFRRKKPIPVNNLQVQVKYFIILHFHRALFFSLHTVITTTYLLNICLLC